MAKEKLERAIPIVMRVLGVKPHVAYRLCREGLVKTRWFGGVRYIDAAEVARIYREGTPPHKKPGRPRNPTFVGIKETHLDPKNPRPYNEATERRRAKLLKEHSDLLERVKAIAFLLGGVM